MTYMNQGRAQKWANRVYHWEVIPANAGSPHFVDWDDFRSRFRAEFFPLHSDAVATKAPPISKAVDQSTITLTTSETWSQSPGIPT
jgi:hypothetical protein